jgi:hypothetical protein
VLYNEVFSMSFDLFGSAYTTTDDDNPRARLCSSRHPSEIFTPCFLFAFFSVFISFSV